MPLCPILVSPVVPQGLVIHPINQLQWACARQAESPPGHHRQGAKQISHDPWVQGRGHFLLDKEEERENRDASQARNQKCLLYRSTKIVNISGLAAKKINK